MSKFQAYLDVCHSVLLMSIETAWPEFVNKYPDEASQAPILKKYAVALAKFDVQPNEFRAGLQKAERFKYRPKPYDLACMCKGIPSIDQVYIEISERKGRYRFSKYTYSHPVVEAIDKRIGYQVRYKSEREFKRDLEPVYQYCIDLWLEGRLKNEQKLIEYKPAETVPINDWIARNGGAPKLGKDRMSNRIRDLELLLKQRGRVA